MTFPIRYNLPMLLASWMIVSANSDNVQGSSECPVHRGDSWSGDQHKVERLNVIYSVPNNAQFYFAIISSKIHIF